MPLTIRPSAAPDRTIDLTAAITAAVAYELWKHTGGNAVVNWIEAERYVHRLRRASLGGIAPVEPPSIDPASIDPAAADERPLARPHADLELTPPARPGRDAGRAASPAHEPALAAEPPPRPGAREDEIWADGPIPYRVPLDSARLRRAPSTLGVTP